MLVPYIISGHRPKLDYRHKLQRAVIKTLAYSAVFNYPLTAQEIRRYLVSKLPVCHSFSVAGGQIDGSVQRLLDNQIIGNQGKYYYLDSFESGVIQRERRKVIADTKLLVLERFITLAKYIPTIKFIGISGALAMENAHKEDDIDLFIITKTGTVWLTRLLCILLAEGLGLRRRPNDIDVQDKLCLNMFVDEKHLAIPRGERDLFSAHEVIQLKPVYSKEHVYERFLAANIWVRKYLGNSISFLKVPPSASRKERPSLVRVAEQIAHLLQRLYMQRHVTNEVLTDGYLRFHPSDARRFIFRRYKQVLQKAFVL